MFQTGAGEWVVMCPASASQRRFRLDLWPALVGITEPTEAVQAIYEAMLS